MERADDSQGSQDEPQPSSKASQIPEDDAEALMVEKFANEAHTSSESDEEALETPKERLSTFSLFRNGPWGVIHACIQGANRAACGTSKTSAAFAPSCPLPQFYCRRKALLQTAGRHAIASNKSQPEIDSFEHDHHAQPAVAI